LADLQIKSLVIIFGITISVMQKLLFVCTINKMRSLTAEKVYEKDDRFIVKSAGTDSGAAVRINRDILEWADYVLVMERRHRNIIRKEFPDLYQSKRIICLYIPDEYDFMDDALIYLIKSKMKEMFGKQ
jgi:predicted protein tyrosine phosphatase